jgi:hypothetical protein
LFWPSGVELRGGRSRGIGAGRGSDERFADLIAQDWRGHGPDHRRVFLLYRQLLSLRIYAKLGATQTLVVVVLVAILVWLTAMTALLKNDKGAFALVFGNENQVIQGAPIDASK